MNRTNSVIIFFVSVTDIGGAETNIIKISKELVNLGYKIVWITFENNGSMFLFADKLGIETFVIGLPTTNPLMSLVLFRKVLRKFKPNYIVNFGLRVEIFSRVITKIIYPYCKIVSSIRTTDTFRKKRQVFLDRLTSVFVDFWISNSIAGANSFIKREKVKPNKIEIIYNYIDESDFENFKVESNNKNGHIFKIGVLANYRELKGHFDLIPLAHLLLQKKINFQFICVGKDHTEGRFRKLVEENGLNNSIVLEGFTNHKTTFFNSIDLFFLPTYMEGMPTSILESMLFKVPVISTNIDGIPEQITNGINGFLYQPGDIEGFSDGICKLHSSQYLREMFIENSSIKLKNEFSKNIAIQKWLAAFNK